MSIITDASGSGIGGVLQVRRDNEWEVAAFFSKQTRGPERRYSAIELEALALVDNSDRQLVAYTDHKPPLSQIA